MKKKIKYLSLLSVFALTTSGLQNSLNENNNNKKTTLSNQENDSIKEDKVFLNTKNKEIEISNNKKVVTKKINQKPSKQNDQPKPVVQPPSDGDDYYMQWVNMLYTFPVFEFAADVGAIRNVTKISKYKALTALELKKTTSPGLKRSRRQSIFKNLIVKLAAYDALISKYDGIKTTTEYKQASYFNDFINLKKKLGESGKVFTAKGPYGVDYNPGVPPRSKRTFFPSLTVKDRFYIAFAREYAKKHLINGQAYILDVMKKFDSIKNYELNAIYYKKLILDMINDYKRRKIGKD